MNTGNNLTDSHETSERDSDMASIVSTIIKTPEAEHGGEYAQRGFDYQSHWAVCHLLELHKSGDDYLIAVECHDDVLECNPSSERIKLYQIKTSETGLTINSKRTKEITYLGKLFCHLSRFGKHKDKITHLTLVTNKDFEAQLVDSSKGRGKTDFTLQDFKEQERDKIIAAIKTAFPTELKEIHCPPHILHFKVSDLNLRTHRETTTGKVTVFLKTYGKEKAAQVFLDTLIGEIKRSIAPSKTELTETDFLAKKAFTKNRFETMLAAVVNHPYFEEEKQAVLSRLDTEKIPLLERKQLVQAFQAIEVDRIARNDRTFTTLINVVKSICAEKLTDETRNLRDAINLVYSTIKALPEVISADKDEHYLKGLIALELLQND